MIKLYDTNEVAQNLNSEAGEQRHWVAVEDIPKIHAAWEGALVQWLDRNARDAPDDKAAAAYGAVIRHLRQERDRG